MYRERIEDLSVYYWTKNLFSDVTWVTIVDGFPTVDLIIPSIAIEALDLDDTPGELGNPIGITSRRFSIDVFTVNKSQRDEFGYRIVNALKSSKKIRVYNYDEGFPPDVSPSELACLTVRDIHYENIRILPELVSPLYYRASVTFLTERNEL